MREGNRGDADVKDKTQMIGAAAKLYVRKNPQLNSHKNGEKRQDWIAQNVASSKVDSRY